MRNVLITDAVHPLLIDGLKARSYTVDYLPEISRAEAKKIICHYEGLVINSKIKCDIEFLGETPSLKWIARLGSGMEVIDADFCRAKNIVFFNTPEGNRQAVAEHTLGLLLALLNNVAKADNEVKNYQWLREPNRGEELSGKTVAIIGFGNTGSAFAKVLQGFDVRILAYDKYCPAKETTQVSAVDMTTIYREADIVSLHLPLTAETAFWADHTFFSSFQKPIFFINTSRGKIVRQSDLLTALQEKKIKAAGLDVLENEQLTTLSADEKTIMAALHALPNVIITPHIAGWTKESLVKIATAVLTKLDKYSSGF